MRPHEECTDTDPEAHAGEPVDDGWDEDVIVCEEVTPDGELDSGAVPGQPQG